MSEQRCGFVAVVGAPNAGKSTLVNRLVGQKVSIVSPKVQTTRVRLMGIVVEGAVQMILIDTPGIFRPRGKFDEAMVKSAWEGVRGTNIICLLVDARAGMTEEVEDLLTALEKETTPKFLIINKVDVARKDSLLLLTQRLHRRGDFFETFMISAETGDGVDDLRGTLIAAMPKEHWHFPEDQVSDISTRLLAAEITREKLFRQLHQELPYACAVETDSWEENDRGISIHQVVYVERDGQKGIVLGKGGSRIKKIGTEARVELEDMLGTRVHLFLTVKVKPDWSQQTDVLRALGLQAD